MPKQSVIIKISMSVFLLLFALIYTIEVHSYPPQINISNISKFDINKNYILHANIISIENINNFTLLKLRDKTGIIDALVFDNLSLRNNVKKKYNIIGRVTIYKNIPEIIIKEISSKH
jgi:DNA/RNA endonuclease YhcR with UshA esterase domain